MFHYQSLGASNSKRHNLYSNTYGYDIIGWKALPTEMQRTLREPEPMVAMYQFTDISLVARPFMRVPGHDHEDILYYPWAPSLLMGRSKEIRSDAQIHHARQRFYLGKWMQCIKY